MSILLAANLLITPACPNWVNGQFNATVPPGIEISDRQKIKNRLRCYHTIILPWIERCEQRHSRSACDRKLSEWLEENFSVSEYQISDCPNHRRQTLMINVRTGP